MGLRLNIGCGPLSLPGEIGVDRYRTLACQVQGDIMALPFRDEAAEFVRLDHVLEHLPGRQAVPVLLEALRVLAPGGTMRIGIPDFRASCQAYIDTDRLDQKAAMQRWFYGSQAHPGEFHQSGWDSQTLEDLLVVVGLADVVVSEDPDRDEGICLKAEGVKPN